MMDLIETIAKSLVEHPDDVVVEKQEDDRKITYHLRVHQEDVGKVIGRQGKIAKAIRTVVSAAATNERKRVFLEIM